MRKISQTLFWQVLTDYYSGKVCVHILTRQYCLEKLLPFFHASAFLQLKYAQNHTPPCWEVWWDTWTWVQGWTSPVPSSTIRSSWSTSSFTTTTRSALSQSSCQKNNNLSRIKRKQINGSIIFQQINGARSGPYRM